MPSLVHCEEAARIVDCMMVRLSVTGRRRHVKHQNLRASCQGSCETHELGANRWCSKGLSGHVHELVVGVLVEGLEEQPHGALQDERRLPNDANLGPEVLEAQGWDDHAVDEDLTQRAFENAEEGQQRRALTRARAPEDDHLLLRVHREGEASPHCRQISAETVVNVAILELDHARGLWFNSQSVPVHLSDELNGCSAMDPRLVAMLSGGHLQGVGERQAREASSGSDELEEPTGPCSMTK